MLWGDKGEFCWLHTESSISREQMQKIDLEKQVCELQGKIVMVQCPNRLLTDKLDTYQTVAEKVAVRVTQYKYQKQRG